MIFKKYLFLLSLLVSPKVFSGGDSGLPQSFLPPNDMLVGRIEVYAEALNDYETFRVETETYYTLNVNQQQLVFIVFDKYHNLASAYCKYLETNNNQDPRIQQILLKYPPTIPEPN